MARGVGKLVPVLFLADAVSLYLFWDWVRDSGRGGFESFLIVSLYCVLAAFVGGWAIRIAGAWSLRGAVMKLSSNRSPDDDLLNALLALVGGLLIVTPGLASDVVGVLLLVPPSRSLARWLLRRSFARKAASPTPGPLEVEDYRVE